MGTLCEFYHLPDHPDLMLMIISDRLRTHRIVHKTEIHHGSICTAFMVHWIREVLYDIPHHVVASGREIFQYLPVLFEEKYSLLRLWALVVEKRSVLPYLFVFRSYLAGSLYDAYERGEDPYGLQLPPGLVRMDPLPNAPLCTPSNLQLGGMCCVSHDIEESFPDAYGVCKKVFGRVHEYARARGVTLVDANLRATLDGVLVSEFFNPSSARFVMTEHIKPGHVPPWRDKEFLRIYAEQIWGKGERQPLHFPHHTMLAAMVIYANMLELLSGHSYQAWYEQDLFDFHR